MCLCMYLRTCRTRCDLDGLLSTLRFFPLTLLLSLFILVLESQFVSFLTSDLLQLYPTYIYGQQQ